MCDSTWSFLPMNSIIPTFFFINTFDLFYRIIYAEKTCIYTGHLLDAKSVIVYFHFSIDNYPHWLITLTYPIYIKINFSKNCNEYISLFYQTVSKFYLDIISAIFNHCLRIDIYFIVVQASVDAQNMEHKKALNVWSILVSQWFNALRYISMKKCINFFINTFIILLYYI